MEFIKENNIVQVTVLSYCQINVIAVRIPKSSSHENFPSQLHGFVTMFEPFFRDFCVPNTGMFFFPCLFHLTTCCLAPLYFNYNFAFYKQNTRTVNNYCTA